MNVTTLIDKIVGKQKQREQSRVNDFRSLIRSIASGQEPDVDQVDRILSENGKSIEDLGRLVELYQCRVALRKQFDEIPRLEAERKDLIEKINKADKELDTAERKHDEVTGPIRGRLEFLARTMDEATRARQLLWDNCPDDKLRVRLNNLEKQCADVSGQVSNLRLKASDLRSWAKTDRNDIARAPTRVRAQELTERAARRDAKAAELEAELAEQLKLFEELEKQIEQTRDSMLEP